MQNEFSCSSSKVHNTNFWQYGALQSKLGETMQSALFVFEMY